MPRPVALNRHSALLGAFVMSLTLMRLLARSVGLNRCAGASRPAIDIGILPNALMETLGFAVFRVRLLAVVVRSFDAGTLSNVMAVSVHAVSKCALIFCGVIGVLGGYFVCLLGTTVAKRGLTTCEVLLTDIARESTVAVPTPPHQKAWW